jgi:hypothetical protein
MLIAGVLCLCAAAASAVLGARALARPAPADGAQKVLRAVAPTQLAAAVMLAAGGVVALSNQPSIGLLVLCVAGAVGTVAAGVWQAPATRMRRFAQATQGRPAGAPVTSGAHPAPCRVDKAPAALVTSARLGRGRSAPALVAADVDRVCGQQ